MVYMKGYLSVALKYGTLSTTLLVKLSINLKNALKQLAKITHSKQGFIQWGGGNTTAPTPEGRKEGGKERKGIYIDKGDSNV